MNQEKLKSRNYSYYSIEKTEKPIDPVKIYIASKTFYAEKIKETRKLFEGYFYCTSSWLDLDPESDFVINKKNELWDLCRRDVQESDILLVYSGSDSDDHVGALVEIGMAMGFGIPVYSIGKGRQMIASDNSDVAFTHHYLYKDLQTDDLNVGLNKLLNVLVKKED